MAGRRPERLEWLEEQRSRRRFNLGDYDVVVTPSQIKVEGKTPSAWGKHLTFDRAKTSVTVHTESRTPLFIFVLAFLVYALGFIMFFVSSGVSASRQIAMLGVGLAILLIPTILDLSLPLNRFAVATGVFFVAIFTLPAFGFLKTSFSAVEQAVGKGHVEEFIIFASLFPIALRRMVSQMMVNYRVRVDDGESSFETVTESSAALALQDYLRVGGRKRTLFRLPSFFLRLSKRSLKYCEYCGKPTMTECHRCHRPMCDDHSETLRGYKVCLDCFVERRGKIRHIYR